MDNQFPEEIRRSDVDYFVDIVPFSKKTLIFGIYTKLNEFERHFETILTRYKYIALTWLLATFAGIGFLLSNETESLPFPHMVAVAIISFIGLIGVSLIANFDINVYHRFWAALFVEEVVMEEKYKFLLQSRKMTLLIDETKERVFSQILLYLTANTLFIITIEVCLIYEFSRFGNFFISAACLFSVAALILAWILMLNNSRKIQHSLHNLLDKRSKK